MDNDEIWNINMHRLMRYMRKLLPFFDIKQDELCADMGDKSPKMEIIKDKLGINVEQICDIDFNFDEVKGSYDTIFALQVVEHLQNPLWFMLQLKNALKDDGKLYVSLPCNPKWLWIDSHYNEISKKYFEKWILKPIGLRITKYKRINFVHNWKGIFFGVRPILRVIRGEKDWQSLFRTFLYYRYDIYEIRKI